MAQVALKSLRAAALALLVLPLAGCLSPREHRLVDAWLHCTECSDGEADSLASLGQRKPWALFRRLRRDVLAGPNARRRDNVQQQFRHTWQSVQDYSIAHPAAPSGLQANQTEFVRSYFDNYVALYRVRAGIGLARVAKAGAVPVLEAALTGELSTPGDTLRNDVRAALEIARDSVAQ